MSSPPSRLPGLDLLRALAITWVLLFHGRVLRLGTTIEPVSRFGWMGVDLFFALSGYLIGTQWLSSLGRPRAFRDFYRRRFFRIVPAYSVLVAVYFGLPSLRETAGIMPLWQFLSFTENLFIDFTVPRAFSHVWSLCVEEHFYLVFPLLSFVLLKARPRWAVPVLVALVIGGVALRVHLWRTHVAPAENSGTAYFEHIYYPTWTRLDGLLAGLGAAALRVYRPAWFERLARKQGLLLAAVVGALGASFALFAEGPTEWAAAIGFPLVALGMGALVVASTRWSFEVPGARGLATGAYSLYLSHKLALAFIRDRWGEGLQSNDLVAFGVYSAAALAIGGALYWLVERPFLRLRERRDEAPSPSVGVGLLEEPRGSASLVP
jgi:peptidoglycan/LPS O-acetylase OafA/YrhL